MLLMRPRDVLTESEGWTMGWIKVHLGKPTALAPSGEDARILPLSTRTILLRARNTCIQVRLCCPFRARLFYKTLPLLFDITKRLHGVHQQRLLTFHGLSVAQHVRSFACIVRHGPSIGNPADEVQSMIIVVALIKTCSLSSLSKPQSYRKVAFDSAAM